MNDRTTPPAEPAPGSPAGASGTDPADSPGDPVVEELVTLRAEAAHLRAALTSRAVIDQAKGILMHRFQLDPPSAFALLKRLSQDHNVKVRDLAGALVAATARDADDRPAPDGPTPHEALVARLLAGGRPPEAESVQPSPADEESPPRGTP